MRDNETKGLTDGRHKEHTVSVKRSEQVNIALSRLLSFSILGDSSANSLFTHTLFRPCKKSLLDLVQSFVSTLF